jgi:uroporphyrinogen-III decarboxylase
MRSRDRVLAAIHHQSGDRVPVNYVGTPEITQALQAHFGVSTEEAILDRLGADLRTVEPPYTGPDRGRGPDGTQLDMWGVGYEWVDFGAGAYREATYLPFAQFQTIEDVEAYDWPSPDDFDYTTIPQQCRNYQDYARLLGSPGAMDLINGTARGRGVEQLLIDIAVEDPVGLACMEKRHQFFLAHLGRSLEAAAGGVDILFLGDDYGTQRGQLVSRECFKKLFAPKLAAFADLARSYDIPLMLHSCGSNRLIMNDLIETGVSIYDTVQPEAAGMDPAQLKAEFGDRMAWHGTISTQKTLPFGSPEDVAAEVRHRIEVIGRNGGLILAPSHNIQPDTPLQNVLALYQAAGTLQE